jgi:hypothetical protein
VEGSLAGNLSSTITEKSHYDLRVLPPYRGVTPKVHETACVGDSAQVIGDVGLGLTT